jgi:hypothetical protein
MSRTRCGASSRRAAEPGSSTRRKLMGPGSAAYHAARAARCAAEPGPCHTAKVDGRRISSAPRRKSGALRCIRGMPTPRDRRLFAALGRLVSRTRCGASSRCAAEPGSSTRRKLGPGSAAHHAARHSASQTRVNALMALRCIRGTMATSCDRRFPPGLGRHVSRTRCGASSRCAAEPGPVMRRKWMGPGSAAHHAARHSAS